jgi:cell division protease FtsH
MDVEKMMMRLVSETRELLSRHINLLQTLSQQLAQKGQLESTVTAEIATQLGMKVEVKPEGHLHIPAYDTQLDTMRVH